MIELAPERIAEEAAAEIVRRGRRDRPVRAAVDTRALGPGELFFGLRGERADGGEFAAGALATGAWGVVVEPGRAAALAEAAAEPPEHGGWVLAAPDPQRALQRLARGWRRELGCAVVGITGSTGKTSVKDICRAILTGRVHASPENYNTEVGLPLAILSAPPETDTLVLEMAMRGLGQIAELCEIAEPDVGAIINIGPVHLELLGTLEAVVAAKAEILAGLRPAGRAVIPADAEALAPHLDDELPTLTFGPGGDVFAASHRVTGRSSMVAEIATPAGEASFAAPFAEAHNLANLTCAVAIGVALDVAVEEMARRTPGIAFSRLRGELVELRDGIVLVNDCYNANPVSMRAALDHLAAMDVPGRRLAVLGGMLELGPETAAFHREVGAHARELGIDELIGVGELARDFAPDEWAPDPEAATRVLDETLAAGDAVLVKGSRAIGLEWVSDELVAGRGG